MSNKLRLKSACAFAVVTLAITLGGITSASAKCHQGACTYRTAAGECQVYQQICTSDLWNGVANAAIRGARGEGIQSKPKSPMGSAVGQLRAAKTGAKQ